MAEYSREQRTQQSRAIANSETGSKQLKGFTNGRLQLDEYDETFNIDRHQNKISDYSSGGVVQCVSLAELRPWIAKHKKTMEKLNITMQDLLPEGKNFENTTIEELNAAWDRIVAEKKEKKEEEEEEEERKDSVTYEPILEQPREYARTSYRDSPKKLGNISIKIDKDKDFTSAKVEIIYIPIPGTLPEDTVIGFLQVVKSSKIDSYAGDRKTPSGYTVDRQGISRHTSPFFGIPDTGYTEKTSEIELGNGVNPAKMTDSPMWSKMGEVLEMQFETAAIVIDSSNTELKGGILALVKWSLTINPWVSIESNPLLPDTNYPSEDFIEAVMFWNSKKYHDPKSGQELPAEEQKRELVDLGLIVME